jgi:hypothetical protein
MRTGEPSQPSKGERGEAEGSTDHPLDTERPSVYSRVQMANSPVVAARVPPKIDEAIRERAAREGRPLSDVIVAALAIGLGLAASRTARKSKGEGRAA